MERVKSINNKITHANEGTAEPAGTPSEFVVAHLSDPHLTTLEGVNPRDLLNKRILGYLSWRLHRRNEYRGEVLEALVKDLKNRSTDHVVITGDLTQIGLPQEFQQVSRWLAAFGKPYDITIVPGNHDCYVRESWQRTFALWAPYMDADSNTASADQATFPSYRQRGPLALIGLSSAVSSPPFFATGELGVTQLDRLDSLLATASEQGLLRVVLIHHPPVPGTVVSRKRLTDEHALFEVLAHRGAELILHGHAHKSHDQQLSTPQGDIPVIGVTSASAMGSKPGRQAQYHLYRFIHKEGGWRLEIEVRGLVQGEGRFENQGGRYLAL